MSREPRIQAKFAGHADGEDGHCRVEGHRGQRQSKFLGHGHVSQQKVFVNDWPPVA